MADEPEFVRLFLPKLKEWIGTFTINPSGVAMITTDNKQLAGVYLSPTAQEISAILNCCPDLEIQAATFAEWIERGEKKPNQ